MNKFLGPTFRYGPNGEAEIFTNSDDVPAGWADSPQKAKANAAKAAAPVEPPPAPKPTPRRPVRLNALTE